jgi:hypothetical protein
MFATTVRFSTPADTDWERLRQLAVRGAFDVYRTTPGLRAIAFVLAPERSELGANCVWETQDHAEAFLRSDAWRAVLSLYGEPRLERAEICAYVEDGDLEFPAEYDVRTAAPGGASQPSASTH